MRAPLLEALDALFERLGWLLNSERRFNASRRRALRQAMDGCDRASRVLEQLPTLSRLEAEPASRPQPVDLAALSREVVAELAASAPAAQHALGLDVQAGLCQVAGNPTLLKLLMRNLLDNALRYSPRGRAVPAHRSMRPARRCVGSTARCWRHRHLACRRPR